MLNFITGLLIDLSFFGGIILSVMSFFNRYKQHRFKLLTVGLILVTIGIIFLDTSAISEAFQKGREAAMSM
ncbi:hypothetical protein [Rhodohalobacter sp. 614A]|uniref:hypothetical protein n=1 Tax=Rhodohalobacter sp. 614A TaxID=2908649 RepID=UPI001F294619|nr:hypothetical protein [Rhodohalobacter sp. 614A]